MEKFDDLKIFLLEHRYLLIFGLAILILISMGSFYLYQRKVISNTNNVVISNNKKIFDNKNEIEEDFCNVIVDIKGQVKNPGMYQVKCGSRVQDVINLAGGIKDQADTSVLNLGKKVIDEMVIVVYSRQQVANFINTKDEEAKIQVACQVQNQIRNDACIEGEDIFNTKEDTPVNNTVSLNKASKEELMSLPGIGSSKADSIITYRKENGGFKNISELKNIKGIGDSIFEQIKTNITV